MVDFAVAPFGWRKDRLEVIDYIPMNPASVAKIYIRNPVNTFSVDWKVYFSPLTGPAWVGILLLLLLAPAIMTFIVGCKFSQLPTKYIKIIKFYLYIIIIKIHRW